MKPNLLLPVLFIFLFSSAECQNYTRDAGIRGGTFSGITYRQYIDETDAFEALVSFAGDGMRITLLKENFKPALEQFSENLTFVVGYGAHFGAVYSKRYSILFREYVLDQRRLSPLVGFDAIFGLEYHFREFPFILGIDYKPFFEFSTHRFFYIFLDDTALSFKYKF